MKSHKWMKLFAIIIPLFIIGIMVYLYNSIQDKKTKRESIKQIPKLAIQTISGEIYSIKNLDKDKNKILVYFDVECDYCHSEAEELSKIYTKYPNIIWIWISKNEIQKINEFASKYDLKDIENIKWCYDDAKLYADFGITSVPYFIGYDKKNILKIRHKGASKLENIIKSIK